LPMSAQAIEQAIALAEAHYGRQGVGVKFRELITSAARRPAATRPARRGWAAYMLAKIFQAPQGSRPCDVCDRPAGHWCEACSTRDAGAKAEPRCSACDDCGRGLLCEHGELALGPGAGGPGHSE
jgi:hypothetical protein